MEPGGHELLVHIGASSSAHDDKRYIAIAGSVLDFRPAIITRVSGPNTDLSFTLSSRSKGNEEEGLPTTRLVLDRLCINAGRISSSFQLQRQESSTSESTLSALASRRLTKLQGPELASNLAATSDYCP